MRKSGNIVHCSHKQLEAMIARGEDRPDWKKVDQVTGARLEGSIRADPDDVHEDPDWTQATVGLPARKDHINIRVDHDVLEWFRSNGRGYQTLTNNVLRSYMQARQRE